MYGNEVEGVIRSTFIIDPEGKIRHVWGKVTVDGHVKEVVERLSSLQAG